MLTISLWQEKLIPKFVNQLMRKKKLTIVSPSPLTPSQRAAQWTQSTYYFQHGTGQNTRNFLYVEDVASAFETVLHMVSFSGRFCTC
jgi:dTDP-D-glucose 4,6-dehydratase